MKDEKEKIVETVPCAFCADPASVTMVETHVGKVHLCDKHAEPREGWEREATASAPDAKAVEALVAAAKAPLLAALEEIAKLVWPAAGGELRTQSTAFQAAAIARTVLAHSTQPSPPVAVERCGMRFGGAGNFSCDLDPAHSGPHEQAPPPHPDDVARKCGVCGLKYGHDRDCHDPHSPFYPGPCGQPFGGAAKFLCDKPRGHKPPCEQSAEPQATKDCEGTGRSPMEFGGYWYCPACKQVAVQRGGKVLGHLPPLAPPERSLSALEVAAVRAHLAYEASEGSLQYRSNMGQAFLDAARAAVAEPKP
jgi:hypothetical protein